MNAILSCFNIAEMLTKLSVIELLGRPVGFYSGIKTQSLMAILLGIGTRGGSRKAILVEIIRPSIKPEITEIA